MKNAASGSAKTECKREKLPLEDIGLMAFAGTQAKLNITKPNKIYPIYDMHNIYYLYVTYS